MMVMLTSCDKFSVRNRIDYKLQCSIVNSLIYNNVISVTLNEIKTDITNSSIDPPALSNNC